MKSIYVFGMLLLLSSACVSKKVYNEEVRRRLEVEDRNLQYTAEVRAVGQRSDRINATIATLESELAQEKAAAAARIATLEAQIVALQGQQADSQQRDGARIAELQTRLKTVEGRIAAIDAAKQAHTATITDLYTRVATTLNGYPQDDLQVRRIPDGVRIDVASGILFRDEKYDRIRTDGKQLLTALSFALQEAPDRQTTLEGASGKVLTAQQMAAGLGDYLVNRLGWSPGTMTYRAKTISRLPAEKVTTPAVTGDAMRIYLTVE